MNLNFWSTEPASHFQFQVGKKKKKQNTAVPKPIENSPLTGRSKRKGKKNQTPKPSLRELSVKGAEGTQRPSNNPSVNPKATAIGSCLGRGSQRQDLRGLLNLGVLKNCGGPPPPRAGGKSGRGWPSSLGVWAWAPPQLRGASVSPAKGGGGAQSCGFLPRGVSCAPPSRTPVPAGSPRRGALGLPAAHR